ncbi:hypothetical protein [Streptomyces sp. NBC_00572]|nr:hypothetical protein [Streptomyces sp. NBC_00572]MCX4985758.1 hypothetical protein [Streptomyces sp. NBC_00572]
MGTSVISDDLGRFATAQDAVATALRNLPSDVGPPTLGG